MGQAIILFYFSDAGTKENGALIISADREGWRKLLESVVNEAYKAKNPILEAQNA